ncbi:UDP-N-acetylglucosamine 4,6-dehydratase (inverting) [Chlamydiales bacterium STE3]|nr:UDP-N-acetylglucosamine 4,6-dehydratase (inverting) [Chlamydiales bacterium STE3]
MTDPAFFKGKNILITGGTGSFGRAFTKKLLTHHQPNKIIIFSRDEWKQWEMKGSNPLFQDQRMRYFLGDVRDYKRLVRAFNEVDIVIHAAALKQVPAAEYNPSEFIKTNVLGAMNIIDAAIECGVKKVLALSSDKAVNPVNLYGATKLCADKLFVAGNAYVGARGYPTFCVVRYGNVAASRGSIIPLWLKMIANGRKSLPVTDPRMTRFWITLDQAVDLVVDCSQNALGGEVFVPKLPSVKIIDIANAIAPGEPVEILGVREGEKLHELMIGSDDSRHTLDFGPYYVIVPEFTFQDKGLLGKFLGQRSHQGLPDGFVYGSDTNPVWLDKEEIRAQIDRLSRHEDY